MRHQARRNRRSSIPKSSPLKAIFKKAFTVFCQLSDPAQTALIVGILLLLAWLIAHPLLLATFIKALLGLITARVTLKAL